MTKPRDLETIAGTMSRAIDFINLDGVMAATGKSQSWVFQVADPDNALTIQGLDIAEAIDIACLASGNPPPFHTRHGRAIGVKDRTGLCPNDRVLKMINEVGKLAETHRKAKQTDSPGGEDYAPCERRTINELLQKVEELCGETRCAIGESSPIQLRTVAAGQGL